MTSSAFTPILRCAALSFGLMVAGACSLHAGAAGIRINATKDRGGFLSESTYRRLEAAQTLVTKGEVAKALENLERLVRTTPNRFEQAVILRTHGNIILGQDDQFKAVPYFEQALQIDELTMQETTLLLYNVAQLYASVEKYEETLAYLSLWRPLVKEIPPEAHLLAATANSSLKRFEQAVVEIRAAIAMSQSPQEQWYQFLFAMLMESKNTPEAIATLEGMLAKWPDRPNYWKQLGSIYINENQEAKGLAVYELALAGGHITKEADILNIVGLYSFLDLPFKAASILEQKIAAGVVQENLKNLETLGNAWLRAQETEKAVDTYRRATASEASAKLDLLAAQLLVELERWDDAIAALRHLLTNPDYRAQSTNPGLTHVLLGNAYFETNRLEEAKEAFRAGLEFEAVRASCTQWLESIEATEAAREAVAGDATE